MTTPTCLRCEGAPALTADASPPDIAFFTCPRCGRRYAQSRGGRLTFRWGHPISFALYPMMKRYKTWKYDWEESYLANSDGYIFPNTFRDIEKVYDTLGKGHGVKFEHECYDTGHLYNLAHLVDRGMFKPPIFLQLIFGILGGIGADLDNLFFMKRTADKLFGKDYLWSVLAGGRHQMNFCTTAAMLGGNVRVGLEDSLYIGPGKLAKSNAEQVAKIRRIIEDLGSEVATPDEARKLLGLKGADRVKF